MEERLVWAFQALPSIPVYSPRRGEFRPVLIGQPTAALDILAVTQWALGRESRDRVILLLWARAIATEGEVGGSITGWCDTNGMQRRTFDRHRRAAAGRVAAWMMAEIAASRVEETA